MGSKHDIADVLVIGAGASGGAFTWSLTQAGVKVVCLEQGGWAPLNAFPVSEPQQLLKRAGHGPQPDPYGDEAMDVERAYQFVLSAPAFRVGTRPDGPMTVNAKQFIVEMYEKFTGKRLLE